MRSDFLYRVAAWMKLVLFIAVCVIAGAGLHKCQNARQGEPQETTRSVVVDTLTYYDTIPYYEPEPRAEIHLGNVIRFLPVFIPKADEQTGAEAPGQGQIKSAEASEQGLNKDTVAVEIPITQREYEGEEYHAWVSGYEPKLDSLLVFPRHDVVTIREPPDKSKRWSVGVFAGYGVTPHGLQPCAGISINYNLWKFLVNPRE